MCGIAAFSLSETSKVNARHLSHALLTQIENRGSHASGFAVTARDGQSHVYKNNQPGSQLPLSAMPRNAKVGILHTRYATQGDPKINANNHPVISTDNNVAVVHNGVIANDHLLRDELGLNQYHGTVDSLVIPSLIAQQGVSSLKKLRGYASIAWLDAREADGLLHIARLKTSPVHYTHLFDGSFVMASTEHLLREALDSAGLLYGGVFELATERMLTVWDGFILEHEQSPSMAYDYASYNRYGASTAGGHGKADTPSTARTTPGGPPVTVIGAPPKKDATPSTVGTVGSEVTKQVAQQQQVRGSEDGPKSVEHYYSDLEEWRKRRSADDRATIAKALESNSAMALNLNADDRDDDEYTQWDSLVDRLEEDERRSREAMDCTMDDNVKTYSREYGEGFYIVSNEGDMTHYNDLHDLEGALKWLGKMGRTDSDLFDVEEGLNWVNHVFDIGAVDDDGKLISWLDDMSDIDEYESPAIRHLNYIREGLGKLLTLKGA